MLTESEIAAAGTILQGTVGSTVHGTNLTGTDDLDLMGVCIEPPEYVIGLRTFEQHISRDRLEGVRSEPGDTDRTVYSLRKWVRLALKGNPSVLLLLFTPNVDIITPLGQELRALAPAFASKQAAAPYLGFITAQMDRLMAERGGAHVIRPELIEKYGWDTKYGGHILRLAYQGKEYLNSGRLTLPMSDEERDAVLQVRLGGWSIEKLMTRAGELMKDIEDLRDGGSPLPDEPDRDGIEQWMISAYTRWWLDHEGLRCEFDLPG